MDHRRMMPTTLKPLVGKVGKNPSISSCPPPPPLKGRGGGGCLPTCSPAGGITSPRKTPGLTTKTRKPSDRLADLAKRIDRLAPSHRDPEAFHVEKDAIARELHRMARGLAVQRG